MPRFLMLILLAVATTISSFAYSWRTLAPGIEYHDLQVSLLTPWSHIHAFRIDLAQNQLDLLTAKKLSLRYASVEQFAQRSKALIALNGGFFDQNYQPLGLRIGSYQQENPLKLISWWGVLYIKNKKPYLSSAQRFKQDANIDFALQSGPRLLVNGKIINLKPGLAERSALGITHDNKIIIIVTENSPLTTTELAEIMQAAPLNCKSALNLDGGNSSQLKANFASLQINVHGFSLVSDAILVKSRL